MTTTQHHLPFAILSAGSWGTALAIHLSRLGQSIRLWTIETDHVPEMVAERTNRRYLPGFPFPETLQPFADLAETLKNVNDVLIAVPSLGFRGTLTLLKPLLTSPTRIVWATKGLDHATGRLLHETVHEILGDQHPYAVLSGPSFAREVAAGLPTAVVVASNNRNFAHDLAHRFNSSTFYVDLSSDICGVEVGGFVKNIVAIATGISDGMGFGVNARSALLTRGLAEIAQLGVALGGQEKTLYGLSGLGDLVLTCSDDQSRNRRFGLALGQGKNITDAERDIGQVVEGKQNAELVVKLAEEVGVEMPIVTTVWKILQGKSSPKEAIQNLFSPIPLIER